MAEFYSVPKPVVLVIMDGVGIAPPGPGNAVTLADTVNLDKIYPKYPHGSLGAAGMAVGLPEGVDGNSEVGHMNIGSGRVVFQDLPRIDRKIKNGEFMRNKEFMAAFEFARKNNGKIHLLGLVGYGKVHSSIEHLYQLIEMVKRANIRPDQLLVHAILDGRDCSPSAGVEVLSKIEAELQRQRIGRIASFIGRYYAMDRDRRWERTRVAYEMLTQAQGELVTDFRRVIRKGYQKSLTDEYMTAHIIPDYKGNIDKVKSGDAVINFNFRPDRALQITQAFEEDDFKGFDREKIPNLYYVGLTDYKDGFPKHVAFPKEDIKNPLGSILSQNKLSQLRLAESEKFPHVTYFFDGGRQVVYPGEKQIEVPSKKNVDRYDKAPAMSTKKIVEVFLDEFDKHIFDFALVNFAATDMVPHTGVLDAAIAAMEAVDWGVGQITDYVLSKNGLVIITADHGNCEELINLKNGEVDTKHSSNLVPIIIVKKGLSVKELQVGILADIAPTILNFLGIQKPVEMTGRNLYA